MNSNRLKFCAQHLNSRQLQRDLSAQGLVALRLLQPRLKSVKLLIDRQVPGDHPVSMKVDRVDLGCIKDGFAFFTFHCDVGSYILYYEIDVDDVGMALLQLLQS
jgi:hypothetical protein